MNRAHDAHGHRLQNGDSFGACITAGRSQTFRGACSLGAGLDLGEEALACAITSIQLSKLHHASAESYDAGSAKEQGGGRGLFSAEVSQQLVALKALQALYYPELNQRHANVFEEVRKACGSLGQRLLQLATPPQPAAAPDAAAQDQLDRLAVVDVAWSLVAQCCQHHDQLQLAQELLSSPKLPKAMAATLQGLEHCNSRAGPQASAMLMLECAVCGDASGLGPAWVSRFLPVAVQALEVCTPAGSGIMDSALEVLMRYTAQEQLGPLLPRVVAAVLDRRLYLQRPFVSMKAATVLALAASRRGGTKALCRRISSADLSAVVREAEVTGQASNMEATHMQVAVYLADHPSFQAHARHWLVPRLVAYIYRHADPAMAAEYVGMLVELLERRPDLTVPLLANGLLPALARCMVADHADPEGPSIVAQVVMVLAQQAPGSFGAAAHASQALKTALECTFGVDLPALQLMALIGADCGMPFQALQLLAIQARRQGAGVAAGNAARLKELQRLRICAYVACSRVEECRGNSSLKACAACVERVAAARSSRKLGGGCGGNDSSGGPSISPCRCDSFSSGVVDRTAVYCGRPCQVADRCAGHAACLLEPIKEVPLVDISEQQRKQLLQLLGRADNAAKAETLITIYQLFGSVPGSLGPSTPEYATHAVEWVAAGVGKQLVACMAGLEQRRAWHICTGRQVDRTPLLIDFAVNIALGLLFALLHGPRSVETRVRSAALELQQQLCAGGGAWLAFVLSEVAAEHVAGRNRWALMEAFAALSVDLLQYCEDDAAGEAMHASISAALHKATTADVLDAVAECMLSIERQRAQREHVPAVAPFVPLLGAMVQEPWQMQHLARHPAFVDALCCALALPQHFKDSARMAVWSCDTEGTLEFVSRLCFEDQGAADALGAVAERLLPLVFGMLDPPSGRPALGFKDGGVRSAFIAMCNLMRSDTAREFMRKGGWLLKHRDARPAGWRPAEAQLVQALMGVVHPDEVAVPS